MAKTQEQLKPRWVFPIHMPVKPIVQACPCCKAEISNMDGLEYLERYGRYFCDENCLFEDLGFEYFPMQRRVRMDGVMWDVKELMKDMEVVVHDGRGKAS